MLPSTPHPPAKASAQWAYLVERAGGESAPRRRALSYGHVTLTEQTPEKIASDLARKTRTEHSYYHGPLTVHVWPADTDCGDTTRWPHPDRPLPDDATTVAYPADPTARAQRDEAEL